jgi:hypothetical protein
LLFIIFIIFMFLLMRFLLNSQQQAFFDGLRGHCSVSSRIDSVIVPVISSGKHEPGRERDMALDVTEVISCYDDTNEDGVLGILP